MVVKDDIAKTIVEAERQEFTIPSTYPGWFEFAHLLDGYKICKEMGVESGTYARSLRHIFETGERELTVLEARLLLFLMPDEYVLSLVPNLIVRLTSSFNLLLKRRDSLIALLLRSNLRWLI